MANRLSDIIMPATQWNHKTWYAGHFYSARDISRAVFTGRGRAHTGHDAAAPSGSPIVAVLDDGVVHFAGWMNSGIGYAVIVHYEGVLVDIENVGDGVRVGDIIDIYVRHGHIKRGSIMVATGDRVMQGDRLASVGSTGASAGPHDHWSITVAGPEYIHWSQELHLDPELCATGESPRYYYVTHPLPPQIVDVNVSTNRFVLQRGPRSDLLEGDTRQLQAILVAEGFLPDATEIDGAFGPKTEAAVKRYQATEGLVADGIVGQATWVRLLT